jgi:hypothetical protein
VYGIIRKTNWREKMVNLEQQIRNALIEERRDSLYEKFSTDDYKRKIGGAMYKVFDVIMGRFQELSGEDEPIGDMEKGMMKVMMQVQLSQMLNDESLKQMAYDFAKTTYMTKDEVIQNIEFMYSKLESMPGTNLEALKKFKELNTQHLCSSDGNDYYVSKLVEIAEKKGVEHALRKETKYEIIRVKYPTAKEYIKSCLSNISRNMESLDDVVPVMQMDGEAGRLVAILVQSAKESALEMGIINREVQKEAIYNEAVKIYGN